MNLLIFQPKTRSFTYSFFSWDQQKLIFEAKIDNFAGIACQENEWMDALSEIKQRCQQTGQIDAIILRSLFGGDVFAGPAVVDASVIDKLEDLIPQAPMHLPGMLHLIKCCNNALPKIPMIIVFETSFFSELPERERTYAISPAIMSKMNIRRYGSKGICHQAACSMVSRELRNESKDFSPRIISICLESQPEVAAVKGRRVLMVTKGIPGETICGQMDPSVVLTLSEAAGWGPEKINAALTKESGLLGLTGKAVTLEDVFTKDKPEFIQARQICEYRLLSACGAAIAAMGGIDAIVFSGRFVNLGDILGPYLVLKLMIALGSQANKIRFYSLKEPKAVSIVNAASINTFFNKSMSPC